MFTMDFGGSHTVAKLECLRSYLDAFTSAMEGQGFCLKYIDPFAGRGRWSPKRHERPPGFFPQPPTPEFEGSVRIALDFAVFNRFLLADGDRSSVDQLKDLRSEFPDHQMRVRKAKADVVLRRICAVTDWKKWRGFVFIDPFGLPPRWKTMMTIARTRAIDFLCLFPPGINRILTRDGKITPANKAALDRFCPSLHGACYREYKSGFFEPRRVCIKVAKPHDVAEYYGTQLRTIFTYVVRRPLPLNIDGVTYYLWGGVGDNHGASERLKSMEGIFSDPEIRRRAKQLFYSAHR